MKLKNKDILKQEINKIEQSLWKIRFELLDEKFEPIKALKPSDICDFINMKTGYDIRVKSRKREVAWLRTLYAHFAITYCNKIKAINNDGFSLEEIAKEINRDSHATILNAKKVFDKLYKFDKDYTIYIYQIKRICDLELIEPYLKTIKTETYD